MKVIQVGVFLNADSESPHMTSGKNASLAEELWMGKKLFWSRDMLAKHEFDCFGLGLGLWLGL